MLKIKKIEFIKVVYDESLSHNIFSIANITFSNYEPIHGALLYWRKNTSQAEYTPDGDYKFFYDMANVMYFASVKFPTHTRLTRDQRQELAFILLEQRGSVGSYSFPTSIRQKKTFNPKKQLETLAFPEHFNAKDFGNHAYFEKTDDISDSVVSRYSAYDRAFVENYLKWRFHAAKLHPNDLEPYLPYIDFSFICFINSNLSEKYLIEHLDKVDFMALQFNRPVLARLSASFKRYMIEQLQLHKKPIHDDFKGKLEDFIEDDLFYDQYEFVYLPESDEEEDIDFLFFEYERGANKWYGSEHLIKGIPSMACKLFDRDGFKNPTNKEMDSKFEAFTAIQRKLFGAIAEPHWLHRYRKNLNWHLICQYNPYLTEDFLTAHMKWIDFKALGFNTRCVLSEDFLMEHMHQFNHQQPVPLILCHLTEHLYLTYKDQLVVDLTLLYKYMDCIDEAEFEILQHLLEE
ncbi:nucleoside-diphosphate sugar epimerase [Solibacillus sp. FSL H8-0538]|uniref:nucleoside-diphosphate sugar epimerase n=1 Tax=Solibacillus sp. FSL H8-0538 TaxID=2921400 RepID=UPI0030FCD62A